MHETRQAILETARDLYAEEGSLAISMRKIAEQVGISATAIYRHFDDKEHLLLEVCSEGFTLFGASLMKGLRGKTALERLELTGLGYRDFALEHPQYYRVMFMSPHPEFASSSKTPRRRSHRPSSSSSTASANASARA